MGLEEGGVVDDGGQQRRESPEQQRGEELRDDRVLWTTTDKHVKASTKEDLLGSTESGPVGSYVEVLDRLGDVELVHGGDDDGGRGEEEEQDKQDAVDDEAAYPPGDPTQ